MAQPAPNLPQSNSSAKPVLLRFLSDFFHLPRWQKSVLTLALAAVVFGWSHEIYHSFAYPTPSPSAIARWSRHTGAGILIGFIVGWAFRTFLRLMSVITIAILAVFCLLSYLNVMNVDLTAMKKQSITTTAWITDQGYRLRHTAMSHVHSTLGGFLGLAMGARKKMRVRYDP